MCVDASVRVCRQVRPRTLTVTFHAPQTDRLSLGVEEMVGLTASPEGFHKQDDFEQPIVIEPMAND